MIGSTKENTATSTDKKEGATKTIKRC